MIPRIRTLRRRLDRLEAAHRAGVNRAWRYAYVELSDDLGDEKHVELVSFQNPGSWRFREIPGPGPALDDFGKFDTVICLTSAEANM